VYGNLTGAWFSKRAKDFAPGRTFVRSFVRSFVRYVRGCTRDTQEEGEVGVMTMMVILKHNILGRESATRRDRMETTA